MTLELAVAAVVLICTVLGSFLLFREVKIGHQVEELGSGLAEISDLLLLYRIDKREFAIRYLAYGSHLSPTQATDAIELMGVRNIDSLAAEYFATLESQSRTGLERWRMLTVPAGHRLRRRLLWAGFVLLLLAAATAFTGALLSAAA